MIIKTTLLFLLLSPLALLAGEADIVIEYCDGIIEHRLHDRTRVDCLTETHAIEYDFAIKWYEAITQAMYYAMETEKQAGVVLILRREKDRKYVARARRLIEYYGLPVEIWVVRNWLK